MKRIVWLAAFPFVLVAIGVNAVLSKFRKG